MIKTGECYYLDADGKLWLAISYQDEFGSVETVQVEIE